MLKLLITLLAIPFGLCAQKSELYLFDIHNFSDRMDISNPRLLSDFNPDLELKPDFMVPYL